MIEFACFTFGLKIHPLLRHGQFTRKRSKTMCLNAWLFLAASPFRQTCTTNAYQVPSIHLQKSQGISPYRTDGLHRNRKHNGHLLLTLIKREMINVNKRAPILSEKLPFIYAKKFPVFRTHHINLVSQSNNDSFSETKPPS